jgi:endoglucanase
MKTKPQSIIVACAIALYVGSVRAMPSRPALPISKLRANQVGYLPGLPKRATLASAATKRLPWQLLDAHARVVARGMTRVHGLDTASGDSVHAIDFSSFSRPDAGYYLRADDQQSHPFSIGAATYSMLAKDALSFFYQQRSGTAIVMPFAREPRWERPVGHLADRSLPSAPSPEPAERVDASGGWYDAGDHGKYVVSASITVWTLLDMYERATHRGLGARFADGSLLIPENANGKPDLLDEARWEIELLLRLQMISGPLAGMVHHKLHDVAWTPLGTAPSEDSLERRVFPPSTAATLDFVAVVAQAARVYRGVDPAFSERCLAAAVRGWNAALAHPALLVPESNSQGGGAYADRDVDDEFYWAACELWVTTHQARYGAKVEDSSLQYTVSARAPGDYPTAFTWQQTAALGTLSLAFAADELSGPRAQARAAIVRAADVFSALRERQGYGLPFAPSRNPKNAYPWGSNSFVLNNAIVLALAYDFSNDERYMAGIVSSMDYLLGENPLDQSYITGYGLRPVLHPHHRFFAHALKADRPEPPPGFLAGGPNTGMQDPVARAARFAELPPERAYVDDINAYSTNEVAINWNAPLAWVTEFLDERAVRSDR